MAKQQVEILINGDLHKADVEEGYYNFMAYMCAGIILFSTVVGCILIASCLYDGYTSLEQWIAFVGLLVSIGYGFEALSFSRRTSLTLQNVRFKD